MASGPITSWQINGEKIETVTDFIFLGSKITAETLAPWKKSYDQPRQHIKKQQHYYATKVCIVKAMVFPVVMYGCESWTIKKVEHQSIDAVVSEKILESPLDCKEIQPVNPKGNQY